MNPFDLSASDLLIWGIVLHLIADWPLQNDWMVNNKMKRAAQPGIWWIRHPAAYIHALIHGVLLAFVFGWPAIFLVYAHLIIDCRWPVVWWSKFIGQTQPSGIQQGTYGESNPSEHYKVEFVSVVDIGLEVRFWTDQVFHIICIALAAILVSL